MRYSSNANLNAKVALAVILAAAPVSSGSAGSATIDCRTLLSAKEVAEVTGLAAVKDPAQISGDDPGSPVAKGVTTCTYGAAGWVVELAVYGGPSVQSVFDTVWKNKKGTPLAGIGEGAYFDESGLNTGVARAKGFGLTLKLLSGFMTKKPESATMQSWTERILKLVVGRL